MKYPNQYCRSLKAGEQTNLPAPPRAGYLEVGVSEDETEVIINHPDLQADADGCGHIVFSPQQAISFEQTVLKHAHSCKNTHD